MSVFRIEKTKDFDKPIQRLKNGNYKMKSGMVYTCFSTDFLIISRSIISERSGHFMTAGHLPGIVCTMKRQNAVSGKKNASDARSSEHTIKLIAMEMSGEIMRKRKSHLLHWAEGFIWQCLPSGSENRSHNLF